MHVLAYEVKRAHWKMVWSEIYTYWGLAYGDDDPLWHLTPARTDILHAMWLDARRFGPSPSPENCALGMGQLIERLGLHPSTISKCVKGMVKHGFVVLSRPYKDRRKVYVTMTARGLAAYYAAWDALFEDGNRFVEDNVEFARREARHPDDPVITGYREHDTLIAFGRRVRACAIDLGSESWPLYDPEEDRGTPDRFLSAA